MCPHTHILSPLLTLLPSTMPSIKELGLAAICVYLFLLVPRLAIPPADLYDYNPDAFVRSGDISMTYVVPRQYARSTCEIRYNETRRGIDTRIKCRSRPTLLSESSNECEDVQSTYVSLGHTDNIYVPCYAKRPCQSDVCKYDCDITITPTYNATVEARDVTFNTSWYRVNTSWPIDAGVNITGRTMMCDYKLSRGGMSVLYIEPKGTYWYLIAWHFLLELPVVSIVIVMLIATCNGRSGYYK